MSDEINYCHQCTHWRCYVMDMGGAVGTCKNQDSEFYNRDREDGHRACDKGEKRS